MSRARRPRPACPRRSSTTYWPWVLFATFAVAVLPVVAVSAIQVTGVLRSTLSSIGAAAVLSVGTSLVGSALWKRRPGSRDIVFADLMIWGWLRRLRSERRLADARELLGDGTKRSPSRQAELLERLSTALEARDQYTHGHSRRVARYSEAIACRMGLSRDQVAKVRTAAALHDVGKIKTPRDVLNKPGRLTDEEFATIKLHPVDGADLVAVMGDAELTAMVRHHHERLDGRGYPDGLTAADIPLGSRIIAVADTFDAITSTRAYRAGGKHKMALDILSREAGSQLDLAAVAAFKRYYSGRRSVAWWSVLITAPPRFLSSLLGWLQGAGATPIAKGVVAAGAAALVGGALAGPPAPEAGARSSDVGTTTAARGPDERTRSGGTAAVDRRPGAGSRHFREKEGRGPQRRSRRGSRTPAGARERAATPGSRSNDGGSEAGPGGDGWSGGGGAGGGGVGSGSGPSGGGGGGPGGGSDTGGGSSGGGSGGGGSGPGGGSEIGGGSSGGGSGTGAGPDPVPQVEVPELPPPPVELPVPTVEPLPLPTVPEVSPLPEVTVPEVKLPSAELPPLGG